MAFWKPVLGLVLRPQSWGLSLLPPVLYVNTTSTLTATVLVTFRVAMMKYQTKTTEGSREGLVVLTPGRRLSCGEGLAAGPSGLTPLTCVRVRETAVTAGAPLAFPFLLNETPASFRVGRPTPVNSF